MITDDLEPCPFCGANLELAENLSNRLAKCFCHPVDDDAPCFLSSAIVWVYADERERDGTARKWNRRAQAAQAVAVKPIKAKWVADDDRLPGNDEVDILAADPSYPSIPARMPVWVRWSPKGIKFPAYRSCDLCDVELIDEADYERLASQPEPLDGWQDISTAPTDGSRILAWAKEWSAPSTAQHYGSRGWALDADLPSFLYQPTMWKPVPDPPKPEVTE